MWTDGAIIHAISSLPPSDFVAPAPVPWSDTVARNLIPVEAYSEYSESERRFIQLATVCDLTQSETHNVLKVLKDVLFRLEDIRPDLREEKVFFLVHTITRCYTPIVRSTVCEDGHEDDISAINGEISFSNSACDLGIRYPIFQAAIRREHLHMCLKVS